MSESEDKYQQRMAKKKAIVDDRIAQAQEERGVLILLKGNTPHTRRHNVHWDNKHNRSGTRGHPRSRIF